MIPTKLWTESEDAYIRANWTHVSELAMSKELNRSRRAVHDRRLVLGCVRISSLPPEIKRPTKFNEGPFSEAELEFIKNNYRAYTTQALADLLGRDFKRIRCALWRRGYLRQPDKKERDQESIRAECIYVDSRLPEIMQGRKFESVEIKNPAPEYEAYQNAKRIERKAKIPMHSFIGSSSSWLMENA